jgi:hypothetical protein
MRPRKSGDYRCAGCAPIPRDRRSCPHRAVAGSSRSRPSCRAVARGEVDALHRCCPPARRELDRRAGARQVEASELTGLRTGGSLTRRSIHQRFANFDQTKLRDLTAGGSKARSVRVLARQPSPSPRPGSSSWPSAAVLQQRLCATVEGDDDQAPSLTVGVALVAEHHFRQSLQFGMSHSRRIAVTRPRPPLHCSDAAIAVIFSS